MDAVCVCLSVCLSVIPSSSFCCAQARPLTQVTSLLASMDHEGVPSCPPPTPNTPPPPPVILDLLLGLSVCYLLNQHAIHHSKIPTQAIGPGFCC